MSQSTSVLSMGKFVKLVLGAVIFLVLITYLIKGCNGQNVTQETEKDSIIQTSAEPPGISREPIKVTLPNGKVLDAYKGGMEDIMVIFLNDSSAKAGKDVWFDFNELNFKYGTAEILPESQRQLNNIIEILKGYPNLKVKIGGYTDKVGTEPVNKKLSQDRANAIQLLLTEAGLSAQLTGAEGYGSEFAKYPADAPEENRVKDRRVSLSVRSK